MGLLPKRIALVVISVVTAYIITFLEVTTIPIPIGLETTMEDYGPTYTFFTVLTLACGIAIWLDLFMKTEILPH